MTDVLVFLLSGAAVVLAGSGLVICADAIALRTRLGRLWMGSVLLAAATSLPELITDVSAVRLGAPDLAVGDLFGSSMANMLILAIIDLIPPRQQVLQRVTLDHALSANLAVSLNALAAALVIARPEYTLGGMGLGSVFLFLAYLAGTRVVHRHAFRDGVSVAPPLSGGRPRTSTGLSRVIVGFLAAALGLCAAGPAFAWSSRALADATGLGDTFFGTWLVGLSTSLPELVTCLAAVRMGAFDLAVGNLFGSNALNMAILLPLDLAQPGNLFATLDSGHALSGLFAVVLMSLGLAAIVYRAKKRFAMIEPSSLLMVIAYVAGMLLLYAYTHGWVGGMGRGGP